MDATDQFNYIVANLLVAGIIVWMIYVGLIRPRRNQQRHLPSDPMRRLQFAATRLKHNMEQMQKEMREIDVQLQRIARKQEKDNAH